MSTRIVLRACALVVLSGVASCVHAGRSLPDDSAYSLGQFTIGTTTLNDVFATLGPSDVRLEDDGLVKRTCYRGTDSSAMPVVVELGASVIGGLSRLTAFSLHRESTALCAELSHSSVAPAPRNGVFLGMTEQEFRGVLEVPFRTKDGEYVFEGETPRGANLDEARLIVEKHPDLSGPVVIDVSVTIRAVFKNGRLTDYFISRLETL